MQYFHLNICSRMVFIAMLRFMALLVFISETTMQFKFKQNEYVVIFERGEVAAYNPEYFELAKINNYKYNRTQAASNGTFIFKKDISADTKLQMEAFKFMSNEYRNFPILFSYNFLECLNNDDFGFAAFLKCGNLTITNGIIKKGTYSVCNFYPKSENFPPHIPEGSYKADIKWFTGSTEMLFLQGYGTIKYKKFL